MDRRGFLKRLGAAPVAAVSAVKVIETVGSDPAIGTDPATWSDLPGPQSIICIRSDGAIISARQVMPWVNELVLEFTERDMIDITAHGDPERTYRPGLSRDVQMRFVRTKQVLVDDIVFREA